MSENKVNVQEPEVTFYHESYPNQEVLKRHLPTWSTGYTANTAALQMALYQSQLESLLAQRAFVVLIKALKPLQAFARPLLNQQLHEKFKLQFDCRQLYLQEVIAVTPTRVVNSVPVLLAALYNFDDNKTFTHGTTLSFSSTLYPPRKDGFKGVELAAVCGTTLNCSTAVVDIAPSAFAQLCRSLDLGGQYQAHLDSVFKPASGAGPPKANAIADAFVVKERYRFEVLSHIARLREHISQPAYEALLQVAEPDGKPVWLGRPLRYSSLQLLTSAGFKGGGLQGMFMIEPFRPERGKDQPVTNEDGPVVVYMPGEPHYPIREYESVDAFLDYLRVSLDEPQYLAYFKRFIDVHDQAAFTERLGKVLRPTGDGGGFDPGADLSLQRTAIDGSPFHTLYAQALAKLYADARVLAVPVKDKKHASSIEGLQLFKTLAHYGFDLADVFLPACEVRELVEDAFIGLEAWSDGEQQKALDQLYAIAMDVVRLAAPKVASEVEKLEKVYTDGKKAIETLRVLLESSAVSGSDAASDVIAELTRVGVPATQSATPPSAFIEGLVQVVAADGTTRLRKPAWASSTSPVLPNDALLDERGLYHAGGRTWVSLDGFYHEIGFDLALHKWRVLNPEGLQANPAILETNNAGAWRFEGENPMGWDACKAFRRLHGDFAFLADQAIRYILRITEVNEALLRQIHVDKVPPPALLVDCARRFLLDQEVSDYIKLMDDLSQVNSTVQDDLFYVPDFKPYLDFLVKTAGWPETLVLRRVDAQGQVLSRHAPTSKASRYLDVMYTPGQMKAFLDALLVSLSKDMEVLWRLIGPQSQTLKQSHCLAMRISAEALGRRKALFESIYATRNLSTDPFITLFKRDFPSLPDRVAKEIVLFADAVETERMKTTRRIPLRLAERAREYQQQLRVNRALECFYLHMESLDSGTLALGMINNLSEWPDNLELEVRKDTFNGEKVFRSGDKDVADVDVKLVFVQSDAGYQVFNPQGQRLYPEHKGTHKTLAHVLKEQAIENRGVRELEIVLGDLATSQRGKVKRLLGIQPIKPGIKWPVRQNDGRLGYPLSGRTRGLFDLFKNHAQAFSPQLAVQSLYPQFTATQTRQFLEQLSSTFTGTSREKATQLRAHLNELAAQCTALEKALDNWVAEVRYAPPGQFPGATVQAREVARLRILSCWRKDSATLIDPLASSPAHKLDLGNLALGALPVVAVNFDHVQVLVLENIALTTRSANAWLGRFAELRELSLKNNLLATVPEAMGTLRKLESLMLSRNPLTVGTQGMLYLRRLVALQALELEGEEVSVPAVVDARWWPNLVELRLRHCGLTALPLGLGALEPLRYVDLRHNRITDIDEPSLVAISLRPGLVVRLHQNPLNAQTVLRAQGIWESMILTRMGIEDMPELPRVYPSAAEWLAETGTGEQLAHWAALQTESGGDAFVQLVNDLLETADYRDSRALLIVRLWRMIDAMAQSHALQQDIFQLAAHPQTCGDGTMLVFNQLDVRVLVFKLESAPGGVTAVEMFKLIRGLERLNELEKIARQDFSERLVSNPRLDEAEVRLFYLTRLREALELPGQAQGMLFERLSGVDQSLLDAALNQVLARESTPAFYQALVAHPDWVGFLERHYWPRFKGVNQPFHERQDVLDAAQETMTDVLYLSRVNQLLKDQQKAINALALQLTLEIAQVVEALS